MINITISGQTWSDIENELRAIIRTTKSAPEPAGSPVPDTLRGEKPCTGHARDEGPPAKVEMAPDTGQAPPVPIPAGTPDGWTEQSPLSPGQTLSYVNGGDMVVREELQVPTITPVKGDDNALSDSDDKLWDKDIHTRTKSKDAQGRWKTKRGVEPGPGPGYTPTPPSEGPGDITLPGIPSALSGLPGTPKSAPATTAPTIYNKAPATLSDFVRYTQKIQESGKADYHNIRDLLVKNGVPDISVAPVSEIPKICGWIYDAFEVEYP